MLTDNLLLSVLMPVLIGLLSGIAFRYWKVSRHLSLFRRGEKDVHGNLVADTEGYVELNVFNIKSTLLTKAIEQDHKRIGHGLAKVLHKGLSLTAQHNTSTAGESISQNLFQYERRILNAVLSGKLNFYHFDAVTMLVREFSEEERVQFVEYFTQNGLVSTTPFYAGTY